MIIQIVTIGALVLGNILYSIFPVTEFIVLMVVLNAIIFLFALITLPVEFDASK